MALRGHKSFTYAGRAREFYLIGAICFLICGIAFTPELAVCQWHKLASFDKHVGVIYFLPSDSIPRTGFVGLGYNAVGISSPESLVWKTTDGGSSWKAIKNSSFPRKGINSFAFKDSLIGWLTGGHQGLYSGESSLFATTDGGETWSPTTLPRCEATSVYYNQYSGSLFVSAWNGGSYISYDLGATWTPLNFGLTNGFAFTDKNNGIVSRVTTNAGTQYYPFLVTADGGMTWKNSSLIEENWQPLAIAGTSIYFSVGDLSHNIYRSDDAGFTWQTIGNIPNVGHIDGMLNKLYVQQTGYDGNIGLLVSTDQGNLVVTLWSIQSSRHAFLC